MAGATLRSQDSPRFLGRADLPPEAYACILLPMSNRYSLSQTDSPRTTYRVIDHSRDDEPALHPATLPSGAPHPLAGKPVSVVTSLSRSCKVPGEGRARAWAEVGGYAVAVIERVPAWATAPAGAVLSEDPHALDGIPDDMVYPPAGGLAVLQWFAVPTSWDLVPSGLRPSPVPGPVHPHQQRRWQDRYAVAAARASSASRAMRYLVSSL